MGRGRAPFVIAVIAVSAALVAAACGRDKGPPRHVDAPVEAPGTPAAPVRATETGRDARGPATSPATSPATTPEAPALRPTNQGDVQPLIGLVASDDDAVTAALAGGARRALAESRAAGGPNVRLRVAQRESRWGAAAEAAVRLALDEGAVAIIAPPERRRAHPVAQFGTRAGVPIVSTSPAPSVMQAGSKWVTSVVAPINGLLRDPSALPALDWDRAGYDAARAVLAAIAENGLRRRPYGD